MHDVVSEILTNPAVPRDRKWTEILYAGRLFRDDTSYVMPVEGWRTMSIAMGVENMGGPSAGFSMALPTATVTRGAVMQHDRQTGRMTLMKVGQMLGMSHARMDHGAKPDNPAKAATGHEGHDMPPIPPPAAAQLLSHRAGKGVSCC